MEPDGYAVLLDDPNVEGTPGGCGYWYVGAYRTEAVAKNVAERGKQGARVVPMWFARPEGGAKIPEVRLNDDKSLDEVVAKNATFHLEQMDFNHWWLEVESGGMGVSVWLNSRTTIRATYEWRRPSTPQSSSG